MPGAVAFERRLLARGQHSRRPAVEVHRYRAAEAALHRGRVDLAALLRELGVDQFALGLAQSLEHHLLRRLRRDASRRVGGELLLDHVADGEGLALPDLLRFGERYLRQIVRDFLDDRPYLEDLHLARVGIEMDPDVALCAGGAVFAVCGGKRRLYRGDDHVLRQVALSRELRNGDEKVALHASLLPPASAVPRKRESGLRPLSTGQYYSFCRLPSTRNRRHSAN